MVTATYALVTVFQLIESRKVRFQKESPNIVPYLKASETHGVMEFYIKNFGEGVAKDVKVDVIKDFERFGDSKMLLSEIGIVKNGMNYFPPQYQLKFYLGSMIELHEHNQDDFIAVKILCSSLDGRKFTNNFKLSFNQISDQNYSEPPETYIGRISYYLKKISEHLKKDSEVSKSKSK
ncbi:hypothetical protein [Olivibacter sp. XZL3]|uniref:hypothetical protein n=1 Tax=Olivibacter sp. XZL3 TaxID=1735116 RepID=UPI001066D6DE|nr:hypothetical protein [Olivibacter sp. XZL3]